MANEIPEKKARQGGRGLPVLAVLICALVLAAIAWGVAEIYGEAAKTPATEEKPAPQENSQAPSSASPNPAESDPAKSKADNMNVAPVDRNPEVDRDPTPRSSTGGDQPGKQPSQPALQ
ncbi:MULTISPECIES: hypothetical protein [unclassified Mesorhizobium]|uniref:hypothetical protein n=1 Tax=unclassified Mesorhizobium TaxID=325217 RepID=UPI000FCAD646|nr:MULTISPECIES: hypothetical protein [unclassified Mesorhizobium]RUX33456.1 hypothetical protein EOA23_06745 [Mesorhizobium sp. M2A.F.Ca.ET.042.01.1.1]RWB73917.1 MAG: hypothetical protein EOQ50_15610 [Mesorhizobium sp.]RWD73271.1 MAG: hypothetical protein EOS37_06030 [Mesorhizobium sp.]RWE77968.1 MAG: hypothetical protein EOS42_06630 [Mesorhizobium sp.]TIV32758.1 MAG: hypothetical protein E5V90_01670 [Mesorhizobium sp.]